MFICITNFTLAQAISTSNTNNHNFQKTLTVSGGIFRPRRANFNDMYGLGFSASIAFEKRLNENWRKGIFFSYSRSKHDILNLTLLNFSIAPTVNSSLVNGDFISINGVGGIGLSYSSLRTSYFKTDEFGNSPGEQTISINEFGGFAILGSRFYMRIGSSTNFLIQLHYTNHFTGSPERGDFGDIGGFFLQGGFQFTL